jgi:hypothetical protein
MIKRRGGNQIENLTSDHKSVKGNGQLTFDWGVLYTIGKIFLKAIRYYLRIFFKNLIEKYMNIQSFGTTKVPILKL